MPVSLSVFVHVCGPVFFMLCVFVCCVYVSVLCWSVFLSALESVLSSILTVVEVVKLMMASVLF